MGVDISQLPERYRKQIQEQIYGQSKKNLASGLSHAQPKRDAGGALDGASSNEGGGKERVVVRITKCAVRLTDLDNAVGGAKFCIDALRYAKLIPDDDPGSIDLQFQQLKVATKKEQGTLIEIL